MKITVEGTLNAIELTDNEFVHAGGEGSVYVKGDIAYKIYHDSSKMVEMGRLLEFQKIDLPNIIKPEKVIYDMSGKAIGYTMRALNDVWSLTRLFSKAFRRSNNVTDDMIIALVQRMRETYAKLHQFGFLVTDGNELNFMVSNDFKEIYFIDVDGYKTPNYLSRAYNESTFDPNLDLKNLTFTENSDWFAYGVVAIQLLIGIHPFKGIYQGSDYTFAKNDIPERIKKRISFFNKDVKLPRPLVPLSSLPKQYYDWFVSLFETNVRTAPPGTFDGLGTVINAVSQVISQALSINEIHSFDNDVLSVYTNGRKIAFKTEKYFYVDNNKYGYKDKDTQIVFLPVSNTPLLIKEDNGSIAAYNLNTGKLYSQSCDLKDLFVIDNRVYGISGNALLEFTFNERADNISIMSDIIETVSPKNIQLFDGVLIESLMGGTHVSLPISASSCAKIHLKEFDSKRIVNAKYNNKVLIVISYKNGNYDRNTYKVDKTYRKLKLVESMIVDTPEINFTVLEQGVCILMSEPGIIKIFANNYSQDSVNELNDASLTGDITFCSHGLNLYGTIDNKVLHLKM
jgi:hypothetical protein